MSNPHQYKPYSILKSSLKLLYFLFQYNYGWLRNIFLLKRKSSLIIFDRYFDDIIVDKRRYRYGGSIRLAKIFRLLIPKPDLYFVLIASAEIIYSRKREVEFDELNTQIMNYKKLCKGKKYIEVNVDNTPEKITNKITTYLMRKMNERY